jgi:hypothetical protein
MLERPKNCFAAGIKDCGIGRYVSSVPFSWQNRTGSCAAALFAATSGNMTATNAPNPNRKISAKAGAQSADRFTFSNSRSN